MKADTSARCHCRTLRRHRPDGGRSFPPAPDRPRLRQSDWCPQAPKSRLDRDRGRNRWHPAYARNGPPSEPIDPVSSSHHRTAHSRSPGGLRATLPPARARRQLRPLRRQSPDPRCRPVAPWPRVRRSCRFGQRQWARPPQGVARAESVVARPAARRKKLPPCPDCASARSSRTRPATAWTRAPRSASGPDPSRGLDPTPCASSTPSRPISANSAPPRTTRWVGFCACTSISKLRYSAAAPCPAVCVTGKPSSAGLT